VSADALNAPQQENSSKASARYQGANRPERRWGPRATSGDSSTVSHGFTTHTHTDLYFDTVSYQFLNSTVLIQKLYFITQKCPSCLCQSVFSARKGHFVTESPECRTKIKAWTATALWIWEEEHSLLPHTAKRKSVAKRQGDNEEQLLTPPRADPPTDSRSGWVFSLIFNWFSSLTYSAALPQNYTQNLRKGQEMCCSNIFCHKSLTTAQTLPKQILHTITFFQRKLLKSYQWPSLLSWRLLRC